MAGEARGCSLSPGLRLVRSCESCGSGTLGSRDGKRLLRWQGKPKSTSFSCRACKAVNCFDRCCEKCVMCIGCPRQSTFPSIERSLGTKKKFTCWHLVDRCRGTKRPSKA